MKIEISITREPDGGDLIISPTEKAREALAQAKVPLVKCPVFRKMTPEEGMMQCAKLAVLEMFGKCNIVELKELGVTSVSWEGKILL